MRRGENESLFKVFGELLKACCNNSRHIAGSLARLSAMSVVVGWPMPEPINESHVASFTRMSLLEDEFASRLVVGESVSIVLLNGSDSTGLSDLPSKNHRVELAGILKRVRFIRLFPVRVAAQ